MIDGPMNTLSPFNCNQINRNLSMKLCEVMQSNLAELELTQVILTNVRLGRIGVCKRRPRNRLVVIYWPHVPVYKISRYY